MRQFVLATANPHKLKEIQAILGTSPGVSLISLSNFPPVTFPPETGKTYEENALQKAMHVAQALQMPAVADDSGLEIEALPGQLGVYSSRFLGEGTSYESKIKKILELLQDVPFEKRKAKFVCAAAAAFPDGRSLVVRGEVEGTVAFEAKGEKGFGYDPIFWLPEFGKTMAQLPSNEKNKISHRAKAFQKLLKSMRLG